jgi:predicted ArsR family transcriptional regulator
MYEVQQEIFEVAKALGEETRFNIFRRIADSAEPLSVKELVSQLRMHHSAIRIHLNKLEDAGLIYSKKRHIPGAVGRPQLAFLPSTRALSITLPPRNYEFLARLAMDLASTHRDVESLEDFGVRWGGGYARKHGRLVGGPLPLDEALDALMDVLRRLGASTRSSRVNGGYQVLEANCVFAELAADYDPLLCELHQAVMRGMLAEMSADTFDWLQTSRICNGDERCTMRVSPRTQD